MDRNSLNMSPFHIPASHELGNCKWDVNDHKHKVMQVSPL